MSADCSVLAIIAPSHSHCSLEAWCYKPAYNENVYWSKTRSCGEYEQREHEGTAEMAEFNVGLQTWQEERYVITLFLLHLGGSFTSFTVALAVPPLTVKK